MKSTIVKRSVVIAGHKTSVSLEDAFWRALREIARPSMQRYQTQLQKSTGRAKRATYLQRSVSLY